MRDEFILNEYDLSSDFSLGQSYSSAVVESEDLHVDYLSRRERRPRPRRNLPFTIRFRRTYGTFSDRADPEKNYFDFRLYPEPIDWNIINSKNYEYYSIFQIYGYFGASLVTSLSKLKNNLTIKPTIFHLNILEYFLKVYENDDKREEFINSLPKLENIGIIVENKMYNKKETPSIKLVLDIYGKYYSEHDDNVFSSMRTKYIPVCKLFYSSLLDEEVKYLYKSIIHNKRLKSKMSKLIF